MDLFTHVFYETNMETENNKISGKESNNENCMCDICEEIFISPPILMIHMEATHLKCSKIKSHKCNTCAKIFHTQQKLALHIKAIHS